MSNDEITARLELARNVSCAAGNLTLEFFQSPALETRRKADNSPVTQADLKAELLMRDAILKAFPSDGVLGEEHGNIKGSSGYDWILDPIDGTKTFIAGVPLYSVLVAVCSHRVPIIGVITIPALEESVYAARGRGAWWCRRGGPPQPARVSRTSKLHDGIFVTSQIDTFRQRGAEEAYRRLESRAYITRTWGDGYGYLLLATGRVEAMVDPIMNVWDAAAIQPIVEEAGGTFTDWQGQPRIDAGEGVGTNGLVSQEVLAVTRDYPEQP